MKMVLEIADSAKLSRVEELGQKLRTEFKDVVEKCHIDIHYNNDTE